MQNDPITVTLKVTGLLEKHGVPYLIGGDLLASGIAGSWAKRKDLGDSLDFARQLRLDAEQRG